MEFEDLDGLVRRAQERAVDRRQGFVWRPDGAVTPPAAAPPTLDRPLRVLLSNKERTLFNYLADERLTITVQQPGVALPAPPDVVVITRADRMQLDASAADLPPETWAQVAEGRVRLVFDASGEGEEHELHRLEVLHAFLRARGLRPSMAAYVTQDRGYARAYDDCCDQQGLGDDRMRIWVHDLYVQRTFAEIRPAGEQMFQQRLAAYAGRARVRPRQFLSLNRTIRPVKALFLLRLLQAGLWEQGFFSLGRLGEVGRGRVESRAKFLAMLRAQAGFEDLAPALEPLLDDLEAIGPISLGMRDDLSERKATRWMLGPMPLEQYGRSWFSVITESHASDRLHRITEKPFKPLLNFHPFMVLGCLGALRLVRAYGFDTYPRMFDERYDETVPLRARHDMIFEETRRLCQMDQAEIARIDDEVAQTVVFNAWWGLVELPRLFHSHIDAHLVDQLVALWAEPAEA